MAPGFLAGSYDPNDLWDVWPGRRQGTLNSFAGGAVDNSCVAKRPYCFNTKV